MDGYFDRDARNRYEEENRKRWSLPARGDQYSKLATQREDNYQEKRYSQQPFDYYDNAATKRSSFNHDDRESSCEGSSFRDVEAQGSEQTEKRPSFEMAPDEFHNRYQMNMPHRWLAHEESLYHDSQSRLHSNYEQAFWSEQVVGRARMSSNAVDLTVEDVRSLSGISSSSTSKSHTVFC